MQEGKEGEKRMKRKQAFYYLWAGMTIGIMFVAVITRLYDYPYSIWIGLTGAVSLGFWCVYMLKTAFRNCLKE